MAFSSLWQRFQRYFLEYRELGFSLDISRMKFPEDMFEKMRPQIERAFAAMRDLEAGAIANPTEKRMVGHYWLRNPAFAPTPEIRSEIEDTIRRIKEFAEDVHTGKITAENGKRFEHVLHIGIGGSALGPQFVSEALGSPQNQMDIFFFDNTDPEGFDRVLNSIGDGLAQTLVVVVSKSGGTKETRNGMLEAEAKFAAKGLPFARHAVAVTGVGSELDKHAERNGWLARFPMPAWIGGRTSVMSAVGLLPMALEGFDIDAFLAGAAAMDERTRISEVTQNAAMLLALMWYYVGDGKGEKDMVVLPYKDRLALFTKYLQQLVMESLGKEKNLAGEIVHQGIAVYGNKGSTDQHSYVQQLRDGVLNFFLTFVEVRNDRHGARFEVEDGITSGDYLQGFLRGARGALYEKGRESITMSIPEVNAFYIGALIALYERAVGFYGSLVNINAYDQPGVEAGKKAASKLLELQKQVREKLSHQEKTVEEIARSVDADPEDVFHLLRHLASNDPLIKVTPGEEAVDDRFSLAEKVVVRALMPDNSPENRSDPLSLPWADAVRFVRQLSHDLRNDVNAVELQSAYIAELTQDQELQTEIKRLREIVSGLTSTLQRLSRAVGEITPDMISYRAPEFLADMRTEIERKFSNKANEINWDAQVQDVVLRVDPQLLQEVFVELFANAFEHGRGNGPLLASARIDKDRLLFTLHEPKPVFDSATQNWGREPFRNISQRHYGLGLNRVRAIVEAHGGQLQARHDPKASTLVSTVTIPVEPAL